MRHAPAPGEPRERSRSRSGSFKSGADPAGSGEKSSPDTDPPQDLLRLSSTSNRTLSLDWLALCHGPFPLFQVQEVPIYLKRCGSEATNLSALLGNRRKRSAVFWKSRVPTPTACGHVHRTVDIAFPREQMKIDDVYRYTSCRHTKSPLTTLVAPLGPAKPELVGPHPPGASPLPSGTKRPRRARWGACGSTSTRYHTPPPSRATTPSNMQGATTDVTPFPDVFPSGVPIFVSDTL